MSVIIIGLPAVPMPFRGRALPVVYLGLYLNRTLVEVVQIRIAQPAVVAWEIPDLVLPVVHWLRFVVVSTVQASQLHGVEDTQRLEPKQFELHWRLFQ